MLFIVYSEDGQAREYEGYVIISEDSGIPSPVQNFDRLLCINLHLLILRKNLTGQFFGQKFIEPVTWAIHNRIFFKECIN